MSEEIVRDLPQENRPKAPEWTFADWFGKDLTGQTYEGNLVLERVGITSLKGSPKIVKGQFFCSSNELTSLEYGPEEVDDFRCFNNHLTSLKGAPKKVYGNFNCKLNKLTSLEGFPEGFPEGIFDCSFNLLTSLEGSPEIFDGYRFCCDCNPLISLKGAPRKVTGSFHCLYSQITSLEGAPEEIGDYFDCSHNSKLTSLRGSPRIVGKAIDCGNEQVITEGFDKEVKFIGRLEITRKSIANIVNTIPDGCDVQIFRSKTSYKLTDYNDEVKRLKKEYRSRVC